jgi:TonB family protein
LAGAPAPPLAGELRPRRRARWRRARTWLYWSLLVSLLLHLAVLLMLVVERSRQAEFQRATEPASVDVVMVPPGAPEAEPTQKPAPNPTTIDAGPGKEPKLAPVPPPPGAAVPPSPVAPPPLALPLPPAPPQELPQAPPAITAAPRLPEEPTAPPIRPAPPVPRPVMPAPAPHPAMRPIAPSINFGAASVPRERPVPESPRRRGIDLALGPEARASRGAVPRNPIAADGMIRVDGADLGGDWIRLLHEWWDRHAYYPPQAAAEGEDGTTRVRLVVNRSGKVEKVELETRSGSQWLDVGSLAIFRNAMLPPFPLSTPQDRADLLLTINFILVRR